VDVLMNITRVGCGKPRGDIPIGVYDAMERLPERGNAWMVHLCALVDYRAVLGVLPAGASTHPFLGLDVHIGEWVDDQRAAYKNGTLPPDRIAGLVAVPGWRWDPREAQWDLAYAALVDYRAKRDVLFKQLARKTTHRFLGEVVDLGCWINKQRQLYKICKLTAERIARLEVVPGWQWDALAAQWDTAYAALLDYRHQHNAYPAQRSTHRFLGEVVPLGSWINTQRSLYKIDKLTAERIARLGAVPGWQWDPYAAQWHTAYAALLDYKHQHTAQPAYKTTHLFQGEVVKIGAWINKQRSQYTNDKLTPERIASLETVPGWQWRAFAV
jgi:hypothetical protein